MKTYETDGLVIYWKPEICEHAGKCVQGAPEVFNPERKPWIVPGQTKDEKIMQVIDQCPSKALSYEIK